MKRIIFAISALAVIVLASGPWVADVFAQSDQTTHQGTAHDGSGHQGQDHPAGHPADHPADQQGHGQQGGHPTTPPAQPQTGQQQ